MALQQVEPETTAQWEEFFINKLRVSKDIDRKYTEAFVDEGYDGESIKHLLAYSTPGLPSPPLLELGLKAGHCLKLAIFFNPLQLPVLATQQLTTLAPWHQPIHRVTDHTYDINLHNYNLR